MSLTAPQTVMSDGYHGDESSSAREREETELEQEIIATRTLLDFLTTEKLEGNESTVASFGSTSTVSSSSSSRSRNQQHASSGMWGVLKQRLRLKGIACCGAIINNPDSSSSSGPLLPMAIDEPEYDHEDVRAATVVNAEQQHLTTTEDDDTETSSADPTRVSLMRLMAEAATEKYSDIDREIIHGGGVAVGGDKVCCVCIEREKGAAMIPCGHTFCRVCSRNLWLNRGSCPLCNRLILDILHIF